MGSGALDQAEEDHRTGLLRSGQAQFRKADLPQRHSIARYRNIQGLYSCLRLPASAKVHHRPWYKRYALYNDAVSTLI